MHAFFRDCDAVGLRLDARRLRNSREYFRNTPSMSKGCISDHTPLRNSNKVPDSGLKKSVIHQRGICVCYRITNEEN